MTAGVSGCCPGLSLTDTENGVDGEESHLIRLCRIIMGQMMNNDCVNIQIMWPSSRTELTAYGETWYWYMPSYTLGLILHILGPGFVSGLPNKTRVLQ